MGSSETNALISIGSGILKKLGRKSINGVTTTTNDHIAQLETGLALVSKKLSNQIVDKAPGEVVEKEKAKQQEMSSALDALAEKLQQLIRM